VAGSIGDVITYLEMTEKPVRPPRPVPLAKLALLRAERCTVSFYRYLYNTVGEPWIWYLRRLWSDEKLRDHLGRPEIEVFVLYVAGVPAGYYELDRAANGETELCYFGLIPDFIGKSLGLYFLQAAIDHAWLGATRRFWVHTSTFDHPRALGLYQRAGFRVYRRETVRFEYPRLTCALPRHLRHPLLPPVPAD
jgi:ribosomal protein S18 acetylase RimI-like enzyme